MADGLFQRITLRYEGDLLSIHDIVKPDLIIEAFDTEYGGYRGAWLTSFGFNWVEMIIASLTLFQRKRFQILAARAD